MQLVEGRRDDILLLVEGRRDDKSEKYSTELTDVLRDDIPEGGTSVEAQLSSCRAAL